MWWSEDAGRETRDIWTAVCWDLPREGMTPWRWHEKVGQGQVSLRGFARQQA